MAGIAQTVADFVSPATDGVPVTVGFTSDARNRATRRQPVVVLSESVTGAGQGYTALSTSTVDIICFDSELSDAHALSDKIFKRVQPAAGNVLSNNLYKVINITQVGGGTGKGIQNVNLPFVVRSYEVNYAIR